MSVSSSDFVTVTNSWYNTDQDNNWYSSILYGNKYVYSGYALWNDSVGDPVYHNWRCCIEIKVADSYPDGCRLDSLVVPIRVADKSYPYHTKAFICDGGDESNKDRVLPRSITTKSSSGTDKDLDYGIKSDFRWLAQSYATTDEGGNTRPSSSVSKSSTVYFVFKNLTLTSNKIYYIYIVRQGGCVSHGNHGKTGYLSGYFSSNNLKINYTTLRTVQINQKLNDGVASPFDDTLGTITVRVNNTTKHSNSGTNSQYTVDDGSKFEITSVSPRSGYAYVDSGRSIPSTEVISRDTTITLPFKHKYSIKYMGNIGYTGVTDSFVYGDTVTIRGYNSSWGIPAGSSFDHWVCGDKKFKAQMYNYDDIPGTDKAMTKAIVFDPEFVKNVYTITYQSNDNYTATSLEQKVEFGSEFIIGDGFSVTSTKYKLVGWKLITGKQTLTCSIGESIVYLWETDINAEPVFEKVAYNIQYKYGESIYQNDNDIIYGEKFTIDASNIANKLGIEKYKKISHWKIAGTEGVIYGDERDDKELKSTWELIDSTFTTDNIIILEPVLEDRIKIKYYSNPTGSDGEWKNLTMHVYYEGQWHKLSPHIYK